MIIELYVSGSEHPAFYDAYIDKDGNLYGMNPQPRELFDILQVVIERVGKGPTTEQFECLQFLQQINSCRAVHQIGKDGFSVLNLVPSRRK